MISYVDYLESQLDIHSSKEVYKWEQVEEFGRNSFYLGREIKRYNENGLAIFKRPTYNGYLREIKKDN